jgi:hypothetical protein
MSFRLMMLITVLTAVHLTVMAQNPSSSTRVPLPKGEWSATHSIPSGLGFQNPAAEVISNRGDARQGLQVSVLELKNRSSKTIATVRFGWYIYRKDSPAEILASGRSPIIGIDNFRPGNVATLNYPVVRFAEAIEPFVSDGKLSGDFNIEVAVIEVQFDDETVWKQQPPQPARRSN